MILKNDISRCAGRYDFDPDADVCADRGRCKRYLALLQTDGATAVSVVMTLRHNNAAQCEYIMPVEE